jgi:putative membrane protein insertion efficiency factor
MTANLLPRLRRLLVFAISLPIRVYRYTISPMLGPRCRFYPSCSEYALQALQRHGPLAGAWLAVARVCRCHPLNDGGIDPVPASPPRLLAGGGRWPTALRSAPPADND